MLPKEDTEVDLRPIETRDVHFVEAIRHRDWQSLFSLLDKGTVSSIVTFVLMVRFVSAA